MKRKVTFLTTIGRAFAAFVMVPALAMSIGACSDDDNNLDPNEIKDLPGTVNLKDSDAENTATLTFHASSSWTAAYADDDSKWFTFSPESGNAGDVTITITALYNEGAANTGKLTINHGTNTYTVTINQKAGKPDVAAWDKDGLLQTMFAPDPYNATDTTPAKYVINVTTMQDYATLDNAPFEIMTFYADNTGTPTDSLISWVKVKIADGSPAAKDGKQLEVAVDTFAVNINKLYETTQNRYAYLCIVPRGTDKADMFNGEEMKAEYLAMGTSMEQERYKISYTGTSNFSILDENIGVIPKSTNIITVTSNCKFICETMMDTQSSLNWWTRTIDPTNKTITFTADIAKLRTLPLAPPFLQASAQSSSALYVDRGPNMKPLPTARLAFPMGFSYARSIVH